MAHVEKPTLMRLLNTTEPTSSPPTRGDELTRVLTLSRLGAGDGDVGDEAPGTSSVSPEAVCACPGRMAAACAAARRSSSARAAASARRASWSASASASKKFGSGSSRKKNHGVRENRKPVRRPCRIEVYIPSLDAGVSSTSWLQCSLLCRYREGGLTCGRFGGEVALDPLLLERARMLVIHIAHPEVWHLFPAALVELPPHSCDLLGT